jgi:adenylate cyclase
LNNRTEAPENNLSAGSSWCLERIFSRALLASTLGHLGRVDEARHIWAELKEINPKYSIKEHLDRQPFKNQADVARITEGLAKAGLPI